METDGPTGAPAGAAQAPRDEAILAAREFVARQMSGGIYRTLSTASLGLLLVEAEIWHGAALGGAAVELARRLARRAGEPEPDFPVEPCPAVHRIGDRGLMVFAMRRAELFHAGASPQVSQAAFALEMGVARLLTTDAEIWPTGPYSAP